MNVYAKSARIMPIECASTCKGDDLIRCGDYRTAHRYQKFICQKSRIA
jgi:hypothetical protein